MVATVESVVQILESVGFERLPSPLLVGGAAFDFDAAAIGTGVSHDLVIVSSPATPAEHLLNLLSALNRTLDRLQSTRPVSVVLLGTHPGSATMVELESHARILAVEGHESNAQSVRKALAVLLPFQLPATSDLVSDPIGELRDTLGSELTAEHSALLNSAQFGSESVEIRLRDYIDSVVDETLVDQE